MESSAPAKPASPASSGPATSAAGGCLRGCLVGCGAVLGLAFVISVAVVVWFAIPYPERPFDGWLSPDLTMAGRLRLDLQDQDTWALLETGFRNAAEAKHKGLPSPLRELAVERDVAKAENLRGLGGIEAWAFSRGTADAEQPLAVVPVRGYGKVAQTLYGMVTLPIPSSATRNHRGATILLMDPRPGSAAPDSWGLTTFRGHAMMGQLDPTLLAGVDHVLDGTTPPGSGFIGRAWPRDGRTALTLCVDNRLGAIGRLIRQMEVAIETARRSAAEAATGLTAAPSGPEDTAASDQDAPSPVRVDVGAIRDEVEAATPREPVWDGFEGLLVTGGLPTQDVLDVTTLWYPGRDVDPSGFPALMRDLATRLSTSTGLKVDCRVIADDPAGLRATFSFSGVKEMVESMRPEAPDEGASAPAPQEEAED